MATPPSTSSASSEYPPYNSGQSPHGRIDDDLASVASDSFIANRTTRYRMLDHNDEDFDRILQTAQSPPDEVNGAGGDADEEELEPLLKYERLSIELRQIVAEEKSTAVCIHPKFLVLGTSWGNLHMFDSTGNAQSQSELKLHSHSLGLSQVSVDHAGEFVASCSGLDGRVVITGLFSSGQNNSRDLTMPNRRVHSVALDPLYARAGSGRRFLTGDDRVVTMHEKNYFNRYKQSVLTSSSSDGPITSIKWRGYFAAWCCRRGVVVFDVLQERIISIVKYDKPIPAMATMDERDGSSGEYVTRIAWSDQYTLYVAHGDTVRICGIKRRQRARHEQSNDLPDHHVVIKSKFRMKDVWVCGIAPTKDDKVVVLLTVHKKDDKDARLPPEVMLVEPLKNGYNLVSVDSLPLDGHQTYTPHDYNLECSSESDRNYFVLCPGEIVMGRPRDVDDNIDWCLDHGDHAKALTLAESNSKSLQRHSVMQVGKRYIGRLLDDSKFDDAAALCVRVFKNDKRLWQDEAVVKFALVRRLNALAPYMPNGKLNQVRLDKRYYEMVLVVLAKDSSSSLDLAETLLKLVTQLWSPDLYDVAVVANTVLDVLLREPENKALMQALAMLYQYQHKHGKAMNIYLELRHNDVFALIRKHNALFDAIIDDKVVGLMEVDQRESVKLFLEHRERLDPELIVRSLENHPRHLHLYLDALLVQDREESKKYHSKLVSLYADFQPDKLLSFLKSSTSYQMQEALDACKMRGLTLESIFVLARMGDTHQALSLITRDLSDIDKAIEFCKEHDDPDLWEHLIDYSVDKPLFIYVLLLNIGTHVDPRMLIRRIEPGLQIPGLRESLATIMHDHHLQIALQQSCREILVSDCFTLTAKQLKVQSRGTSISDNVVCGGCSGKIVNPSASFALKRRRPQETSSWKEEAGDFQIFMCGHIFHIHCLSDKQSNRCNRCEVKS